jgi:hypothetical protein
MAELRCEDVSPGLRSAEKLVIVRDAVSGMRSFLRVETDFLTPQDRDYFLPVRVVQEEPERGLALIELPQEPDAGNTRLWVRITDFLEPMKVSAWSCPKQSTGALATKSASQIFLEIPSNLKSGILVP